MVFANDSDFSLPIWQPESQAPLWVMVLIGLLTLITIVTNLLVIVLFMTSPRLRSPFNYYLLDIAVHDFLTGAIDLPYYAVFTYYGYWPLSDTHCTIWMWFDYSVDIISLWGLVGVSVDRLWAVIWPLSYRQHNTLKKSYIIIFSGWFITYASMLPGFIYTRTHFANQSINRTCLWDNVQAPPWADSFVIVVVDIFTPIVIIVVSYLVLVYHIGHSYRTREVRATDILSRRCRWQKDRQAFLVLTVLFCACVTAWLPWVVCEVLQHITHETYPLFLAVTYWTSYALSALNPIMFGCASADMRRAFWRLYRKKKSAGLSGPSSFSKL